MELASIQSPAAAFVGGLITSLHCAGMCGPLACAVMPVRKDQADGQTVATVYHLSRLSAYAVLGALAGGLGRAPLAWFSQSALRWLPWATVLFFIALALRWDRFLPKPTGPARLLGQWLPALRGQSRTRAAAALGFVTPLLPCGPLYFLLTLALLSGSALRGAEFMLAFGLGTVPLLWAVQSHWHWLRTRLSPVWLNRLRLGLALGAALVAGWRLRGTFGLGGPDPSALLCF
jgi:sulfite exporter TauE/SafE